MVGNYVIFFSAVEIPLLLVLRNTLTEKEPQRQKSVERSLRNIGLALFILLDRPLDIPVRVSLPIALLCGAQYFFFGAYIRYRRDPDCPEVRREMYQSARGAAIAVLLLAVLGFMSWYDSSR